MSVHNTFAGNPLDRVSERRADVEWLTARLTDPTARTVVLWGGQPLVEGDPLRLARVPVSAGADPERLLFLGLDGSAPLWALDPGGEAPPPLPGRFVELRRLAPDLPTAEAGIAAVAKSLFDWHGRHRFCANCGSPTHAADAGWKRICPACQAQHFPRTDPVAIMLALHSGPLGDRCLLGRQRSWPPGRFSALAGFIEPGETIEEGCARELKEEAGLAATQVRYHSSQPWPWPSQLMIGLFAEVADDGARADQLELEEVRWFTRAEVRDILAGRLPDATAPPPLAIAHQLLKAWAG